ncbi:ferredoxin family protein [Candidatus Bathyarchaeota archaeon]|nr:ferredoxin family protein [Candidatus Bathyarchaeota archaeon]
MSEETYKGIPRTKIPWHPTIDYKKCVNCGKCVEYCKLGVYNFEENLGKKQPIVKNPNNCVVLCTGCQDICSSDAITHQSRKETVGLIRKLLRQVRQ